MLYRAVKSSIFTKIQQYCPLESCRDGLLCSCWVSLGLTWPQLLLVGLFFYSFSPLCSCLAQCLPSHLLATVTGHLTSCSEMKKKKKKNPIYIGLSFSFRRFSWHGSRGSRAIQCVCTRSDGRCIAGEGLRFGSTLLSFRHKQWK